MKSNTRGITLISLVVTIVVLLILAGITIGTVFSDNGIVKKAQEAKNKVEEATRNEQEELNNLLGEMDNIINGIGGGEVNPPVTGSISGKTTWSTGSATLVLTTDAEGVTIQYRKNNETSWTDYGAGIPSLLNGDTVYVRGMKDGEVAIAEKQISIKDGTAPTVTIGNSSSTTNSISITVTATDGEAGMGSSPTYTYYIKKKSEADSAYVQIGSSTNASITKTGLEQNTAYVVKVEVSDVAGNKGQATKEITTSTITDAGEGLTNGAIVASSPTWSNGSASLTLSTTTGLTIQYQKNGIDGTWMTGTSVTGLKHNDTLYARLTDGTNYGGHASITILDSEVPQAATISLSGTSVTTAGSVTATVTLKDNESGVNVTSSKYIYNTTSGNIGTTSATWNSASSFSSNGQTITLKVATTGKYYLHVLTVDNAGNKTETISSSVSVTVPEIARNKTGEVDIKFVDTSNNILSSPSTPKLGSGMTPIKWNGSSWVDTTSSDSSWYCYGTTESTRKWANAKTSDGSVWVWIPRYAYKITYYASDGKTVAGYSNSDGIVDLNGNVQSGTSKTGVTAVGDKYILHPAFNYNGAVSGLWVAKFEASRSDASSSSAGSSSTMKIQPGVQSWRSITVNDIYTNCLNYNSTLKSHMMKNSEWGAVAYLTQSTFGKNEEVWINNSGSYITGSAGNSVSASQDTGTTNDYTSTQGQEASTTGNVTGIYDMSGGAWEYVAGYVNNGNGNLTSYGSSLINGTSYTKDVYSVGSSDSNSNNYTANAGVYGDAVYETSSSSTVTTSWNSDCSYFPYTSYPFFLRGGLYTPGTAAGVFCFHNGPGNGFSGSSFRPVLVAN